jgi:hypothetical protein
MSDLSSEDGISKAGDTASLSTGEGRTMKIIVCEDLLYPPS